MKSKIFLDTNVLIDHMPLSIEYLRGILDSLIQIVEIAPLNKANVQAGIDNP